MSHVPIGAITGSSVAIGAAAAKAKKMREEEEKMTTYKSDDLNGWEFKIVRSATGKFKKQDAITRLCQEEARHGWEMVEKFDNNRIRFKRRTESRSKDQFSETDPYRTNYGIGEGGLALTILGVIFGSVGLVLLAVFLFKMNG